MSFVAGRRIVVYQDTPTTVVLTRVTGTNGNTFTLFARRPGEGINFFEIVCSFASGVLSIPFTAPELATPGNFDYTVWESDGVNEAPVLQGLTALGEGIEIVPIFADAPEPPPPSPGVTYLTTKDLANLQPVDDTLTAIADLTLIPNRVIGTDANADITLLTITGGGDMLTSVYDKDADGIVDAAESVPWSGVTGTPSTLAGYGITDAEPLGAANSAIAAHVGQADPHTQYAETKDLGTAAFTDSTAYATAAQGTLADTAVQPGDLATIATSGSYTDLADVPTNLTQVAGLIAENGKALGWTAGAISNITLPTGNMSTSVYDKDADGIVDAAETVPWSGVTSTPSTLAGYGITDAEPLGAANSAIASHVAELDPHTQYAETADLGTAAFTDSTDYATAAQGALADSALQPGDDIPASDVTVDKSSFIVLTATDAQTALQQLDNAVLLARATGLLYGGEITVNVGNPQRIDIAAGQGQILDDTIPTSETYLPITWNTITAQVINNTGITWFYFDDNSGVVRQTQTEPTVENRRLWVVLGRVSVAADLSIAGIAQDRDFVQQLPVQLREVAEALGLIKLEGLMLTANGANLLLNLSSGKMFDFGSNGRLSPHSREFATNNGFTFQYVKRSTDPALQVNRTTIDPNNYDLNGTITPVTTNRYTVQDIYLFPSGNIRIQYGQNLYNSLADAIEAIPNRPYVKNPALNLGLRIGFLIVQQGTTALNNTTVAQLINANRFGEIGGGVVASAAGYLEAANNLSDLTNVTTAQQNLNLEPGVDVQAYDADLASWAAVTRAAGFDTFVTTPSSANLAALVTGETGSGALVFATSPSLVTPNIGAASGTSLLLSSGTGLTIGSSTPFSDVAGVLTLQNVDALDATTESTIESAIDTLANLTSIQGRSFTFGAYAPTLLNTASEADFKQVVNLEIGVDVQAYDADLAALAGLTTAADRLPYFTGVSTAALTTFTSFARTLLDDADATTARSTLGLVIGTNVQAYDADLQSWAGVTRAIGFDTFATTPSSANLAALVTDETGSGSLVFATSPSLTTPNIGAASGTSLNLSSGTGLQIGSSVPFSDAAGTLTLQNVDALDATTEATIEAAIDTLANLTSIQGRAFTFGAFAPTILNTATASAARDALEITSRVVTVKTAFKTDAQTSAGVGTAGTADISGLSISHAAAASGNTILLFCLLGIAGSSIEAGNVGLTLYADSTPLQTGDLAGNRVLVNSAYLLPSAAGFAGSPLMAISTHAPGSTSTIAYNAKVINVTSTTQTLYINRTPADDNLADRPRTVSSLVLVEIEP